MSAYGNFLSGPMTRMDIGFGLQTPFGIVLPPGGRIAAYVRSAGVGDGDEWLEDAPLVQDLASALRYARANRGDAVVVLPGHSENVTDATMLDNLVAGTRIIGAGQGADMPSFRWTNTAGQWTVDQDNVTIQGLRLRLEGVNGVVKGINVTAADCAMFGNDIEVASGASNKATIAIEVGSAAHRFSLMGNRVRGTETHNVTDCIKVVGATPPRELYIARNRMIASATAANGLINITVAAKGVLIEENVIYNTHTSSTAGIAVANVAADGVICRNLVGVLNNGTAASQGIVFTSTGSTIKCFENYTSDEARASGVLAPAAAT